MTPYPKTCDFLKQIGIDPVSVLVDGVNEYAYREPVLDRRGKRMMRGNGIRVRGRSWPDPRIGRLVVRLMEEAA